MRVPPLLLEQGQIAGEPGRGYGGRGGGYRGQGGVFWASHMSFGTRVHLSPSRTPPPDPAPRPGSERSHDGSSPDRPDGHDAP